MLEITAGEFVALAGLDGFKRRNIDDLRNRSISVCSIEYELLELRAFQLIRSALEQAHPLADEPRRMMRNETTPLALVKVDDREVASGMPCGEHMHARRLAEHFDCSPMF